MKFRRIKYLEWVKENLRTVEHDLATASITSCTTDDLDLSISDVRLDGRNFYGYRELVDEIARSYDVPAENIVVTHGASMGIFLLLTTLLETGSEVILEVPNYEPLYRIPKAIGARVRILERTFENQYQISLEQLERKISPKTEAIIITNTHNPSGVATNLEKLKTMGQIARENDARLICGEAYLESVFEHPIPPAFTEAENAISIGSLSKAYGLGGLRVGWLFCDRETRSSIHSLENYISPRNTFPAQVIAAKALRQKDRLLERGKKLVRTNRDLLQNWIHQRSDVEWVPPDGGPICFFKITSNLDVWTVMKKLKEEYDTLVVPGDFFWAKGFIRIGFGNETEHVRTGVENLGKALDDLSSRPDFY